MRKAVGIISVLLIAFVALTILFLAWEYKSDQPTEYEIIYNAREATESAE